MTETIAQGAANQAGAQINPDAYAEAGDFLPLNGIDHVEFWVGNARQASAYYRAWGFTPVAFSGLETKVRDRASYVMVQNDIRFVHGAAHARRRDRRARPPARRRARHRVRGGRRRVCLARDDVAWGRVRLEPTELDGGEDGVLRKASIRTYGETLHSFVDRRSYGGVFAPGYRKVKNPAAAAGG